ncbi:MAG: hypothetical protein AAFU80_24635 [Pseudomonadota bacterium]
MTRRPVHVDTMPQDKHVVAPQPGLKALAAGRVHEATGPGRMAFALAIAGESEGAILWIMDARRRDLPCPQGIASFADPARLILVRPTGLVAALQTAEEALRAGASPLVIADLDTAPDLTQSRRLQLAASTGGGRGLCLVPESGLAANAAETRWHCSPIPRRAAVPGVGSGTGAPQHWELVKNKRGPLGAWQVWLADRPQPPSDPAAAGRGGAASPIRAPAPTPLRIAAGRG